MTRSHHTGRGLRNLQGHRQTRSQEFLLRICRAARTAPQRHLRHLCIHAQGRRPLRRRKHSTRTAPLQSRSMAGRVAQRSRGNRLPAIRSSSPSATRRSAIQIPLSLLDELIAGTTIGSEGQSPAMRPTPTPLSPTSIAIAISSRRSSAWSASASSATPILRPKSWPKKPASPSNSPTSCAMWQKMPNADRVYLPLEDLAAHNVTLDSILHRAKVLRQPRTSAHCWPRSASAPKRTTPPPTSCCR